MSGFNLWHSQYMQSVGMVVLLHLQLYWYATFYVHAESRQCSSLAEKNKQSALQWRSLTEEERERFCSEAAAHNCGEPL